MGLNSEHDHRFSRESKERPLALGKIRGVREFKINNVGQLTGVTYSQIVWELGSNEATCRRADRNSSFGATLWYTPILPGDHRAASLECSCGFWAYFAGQVNAFHLTSCQVTGIIEAWGLITIGTAGFRAERAEIVALVHPEPNEVDIDNDQALWLKARGIVVPPFGVRFAMAVDHYKVPVFDTVEEAFQQFPLEEDWTSLTDDNNDNNN